VGWLRVRAEGELGDWTRCLMTWKWEVEEDVLADGMWEMVEKARCGEA
jgi:hypothetical protein